MTESTQPGDPSKSAPAVDTFAAIRTAPLSLLRICRDRMDAAKERMTSAAKDADWRKFDEAEGDFYCASSDFDLAFAKYSATIASLLAAADRARELEADARLAAFGAWCAREFRDSLADVDGGNAQDAMERLGVIVKRTVTEPCGEGCVCLEYGDFPHECYKFPDDVSAAIDRAQGEQA